MAEDNRVVLDEGAASVFIGVDPCYQNYADVTSMPIVTPAEVDQLIANGTLQVVEVGDAEGLDNVGVIQGSKTEDLSDETDDKVDSNTGSVTTPVMPVTETAGDSQSKVNPPIDF